VEKYCRTGNATNENYGACALHAGYVNLQTHTQDMYYLLLFHCKNVCTNAPQCYVIRTLPVLFSHIQVLLPHLYIKMTVVSMIDFWLLGCLVFHVFPARMRRIVQRLLLTCQRRRLCRHCSSCQPSLNTYRFNVRVQERVLQIERLKF
jgi:hypothetical protein